MRSVEPSSITGEAQPGERAARNLGRKRLADRLGDMSSRLRCRAPSGSRTPKISKRMGRAPHQYAAARQHLPGAMDRHGDDRHLRALGGRKGASQKPADLALGDRKCPPERIPATARWPRASSTRRASEAPLCRSKRSTNAEPRRRSKRLGQRHAHHFLFDDKGKIGRQGRRRRRFRRCSSHDWRRPHRARAASARVPRPPAGYRPPARTSRENRPATRRRARRPGRNRLITRRPRCRDRKNNTMQ